MPIPVRKTTETVAVDGTSLKGDLSLPENASGMVLFAHGSGSSRFSPRNQLVAAYLNDRGIATFLVDLLTPAEDQDYEMRFHIPLLAQRLKVVARWLLQQDACRQLPLSLFGASTGAAAAFITASEMPQVNAVVSRGGRPDLAMAALPKVQAPTLLIVGSLDTQVIWLNQKAFTALHCEKKFAIVPGATHLFEEQGAMEEVCRLATGWFQQCFQHTKQSTGGW